MRALVVLTTLLVAATAASAQEITPATKPAPVRDGFYIGFGLGAGRLSYGADASDIDGQGGLSGHLRLGGTLNQQWRLGAETNGWVKSEGGGDTQFGALLATATFYPSPESNFFLKGGLGIGSYTERYPGNDIDASGGAGTLGIGYDFRFKGNFGLSLVGNYVFTSGWEIEYNGSPVGLDADPSLLQVGLGVIWH